MLGEPDSMKQSLHSLIKLCWYLHQLAMQIEWMPSKTDGLQAPTMGGNT